MMILRATNRARPPPPALSSHHVPRVGRWRKSHSDVLTSPLTPIAGIVWSESLLSPPVPLLVWSSASPRKHCAQEIA